VVVAESHRQKPPAEAAQAKYAKLGQPVQVVEVDLAKKGHWFRVCLGRFTDQAQAQAMTREWKKQGVSPDPFVARMP
jgi:cell division protein FtsN